MLPRLKLTVSRLTDNATKNFQCILFLFYIYSIIATEHLWWPYQQDVDRVFLYWLICEKVNPDRKLFTFSEVCPRDVFTVLKSLNPSKAAGHDNIPPRMIKDGAEELAVPLCYLANLSLQSSLFPTSEKLAKISPVFKSNDRSLLDNYRPISILSVFSKVLEKIVYHQISNYLEENSLLSPYQFGFRRGRSTQHAVTVILWTKLEKILTKDIVLEPSISIWEKHLMLSIMLTYWESYPVMGLKIKNYCGFKTTSSTDRNTWVLMAVPQI